MKIYGIHECDDYANLYELKSEGGEYNWLYINYTDWECPGNGYCIYRISKTWFEADWGDGVYYKIIRNDELVLTGEKTDLRNGKFLYHKIHVLSADLTPESFIK